MPRPSATRPGTTRPASERPATAPPATAPPRAAPKEPLWRDLVGDVLRRERLAQERTLKDVADAARISMPYLSEVERGRKEASSEVLAAAAHALGLGLGDLLSLAQGELVRLTSRRVPGGSRGRTGSSYDGLCLAA
ncbi:helix-turn-helix transcriptional regulator [Streptomyces chartreusis]